MTKAFIDIVGRDFTGPAFGKVDGRLAGTASSISALTKSFIGLSVAFGGVTFAKRAITSAVEFETALIGVSKTTGIVGKDLADLGKSLSAVSAELPVTTNELLELAQAAGQMGVTGSANIEKFALTVAKLGRASDLSGDAAATTLARILNVTKESVGSVDVLASVLVSLGAKSAASESQIARMTNEIARSTSQFDISSAQAAAMASAMAELGIQAELGGTAVGTVMRKITTEVLAGGESLDKFAQALDLDAQMLDQLFKDDQLSALLFVLDGISDLGLSAGNALKEVGLGGEGISKAIVPLAGNLDGFRSKLELANAEVLNATALNREFEATLDSVGSQWIVTTNQMELFARSIGTSLLPSINEALKGLNSLFEGGIGSAADKTFTSDIFLDIVRSSGLLGTILVKRVEQQKAVEASTESLNRLIADSNSLWSDLAGNVGSSGDVISKLPPILDEVGSGLGGSGGISDEAKKLAAEFSKLEIEAKSLIQAFDPLARRNNELARFVNLLNSGLIGREVFDRASIDSIERYMSAIEATGDAVEDLEDDHEGLRDQARSVFGDVDQFAIQAARNVQTAFANILIDPDGNIIKQFVSIAKRAAAEIVSSTVLTSASSAFQGQSISGGIGSLLSGFGSSAKTQEIADSTSATSSILSEIKKDNISANARGEAAGRGVNVTGGAFTAVGGNLLGASNQITGIASAAAAFGGPVGLAAAGALIAADVLSNFVANDNTLFGKDSNELNRTLIGGPTELLFGKGAAKIVEAFGTPGGGLAKSLFGVDIGPGAILNKLFGRGAFKFRRQFLQGEATAEGFDGQVINQLRSKGGTFRKNRNKFIASSIESDIQLLFDETLQGFAKSTKGFAENLGVSTAFVDNFSQAINLESATKQQLDPEVIQALFDDIGDTFARGLVPAVDALKRSGESAIDTLGRLSQEFDTFEQLLVVTGDSVETANKRSRGNSLSKISGLVTSGGGADFLSSQLSFFSENFFTQAEKLEVSTQRISAGLDKLGLATDTTADQFKGLVQSFGKAGGINQETLFGLLGLAPEFINKQGLAGSIPEQVQEKFSGEFATKLDFLRNEARVGGFRPIAETKSSNEDPLLIETRKMREQLNKALAAIEASSEKMADLIDQVTAGGNAMLTETL